LEAGDRRSLRFAHVVAWFLPNAARLLPPDAAVVNEWHFTTEVSMYVQPLEGSLGANSLASLGANAQEGGPLFQGSNPPAAADNISRFMPPWLNEGAAAAPYGDFPSNSAGLQGLLGPLMGMLTQLMQMLQSLMGYGGCTSPYGGGNGTCAPNGRERFFQNATGSSEGDPHLSFNGSRWNSMSSQPDLLNSNSFAGGYQVSTQVTQPNGRGVTWNHSATVSLNNGATKVSLNNDGDATITSYGQSMNVSPGQTINLGEGESVTCNRDGSLSVVAQNADGGRLTTTLIAKGKGFDVDVAAHEVDLGGALVNVNGNVNGPNPEY
jgi:hypothetical protein